MDPALKSEPSFPTGGQGVWLPLNLATAMMECFFGDGPRARGRTDSSLPPRPTVPPPPVEAEAPVVPLKLHNTLESYIPGPFAARKAALRSPAEQPLSTGGGGDPTPP